MGHFEGYLGANKRLIIVINNKSLDQVDEIHRHRVVSGPV